MDLQREIHALLEQTSSGRMTSAAYDTAWIARLTALGEPMGERALEWLRENQLPNGSWGTREPCYYHDRLVCTLSALTALSINGDERDRDRLRRALAGFDTALRGLIADPVGATIGFEMIAPTLMAEAKAIGMIRRYENGVLNEAISHYDAALKTPLVQGDLRRRHGNDYLDQLSYQRLAKLRALPEGKINRYVTVAFSAEMAGLEGINLFDIAHLQEKNGSVGHSPSASAYFALSVRPGDPAALAYLRQLVDPEDGSVPFAAPFDIFERTWVLWNLLLASPLDEAVTALLQPHLDFIQAAWRPGLGVGFSIEYTPVDGDDTSVAFEVLLRCGRSVDVEALHHYEMKDRFRCYELEANPSISVNCHMLSALFQAGYAIDHPSVQKIRAFLKRTRLLGMYWFDKWHISPYYPTGHAVIAMADYEDNLALKAVDWILETQNHDGSWGYYGPTAEETAYCIQALIYWQRNHGKLPVNVLPRGLAWLADHSEPPYPPLWIGKCLYSPTLVTRSAILSALLLGEQEEIL
ncbi:MAG: prenyltransferase/squalene oxidase repeat-containing protein [Chloroflexota bacterium]